MALEHAADGDRDRTRFLGYDNEHAVRALAHADRRAVARAEVARQALVAGKRQDAAGGADPARADDHRAVMQRTVLKEDILDKLGRGRGIDRRAGRDDLSQTLAALEHDERAGLGARHIRAGGNRRGNHAFDLVRVACRNDEAAEVALADLLKQAAQLGLKDYNDRKHADAERLLKQPRDHGQMKHARQQHDADQHDNALDQTLRARVLEQLHDAVDNVRDDQYINDVDEGYGAELVERAEKRLQHRLPVEPPHVLREQSLKCAHKFSCPLYAAVPPPRRKTVFWISFSRPPHVSPLAFPAGHTDIIVSQILPSV